MEVPDIRKYVKRNELLVTTTYPIKDNPAAQAALIFGRKGALTIEHEGRTFEVILHPVTLPVRITHT